MLKLKSFACLFLFVFSSFSFADPKVNFSGRVALDQISILKEKGLPQGTKLTSGGLLRDAALSLGIKFSDDISFNWDLDFSPSSSGIGTLFLSYSGISNFNFMLGQVPSPFCLENSNSSKWIPHLERSVAANAFKPCIGPGLTINHWGDSYFLAASLRQGPYQDKPSKSDRLGGSLRMVWAPILTSEQVIHLGVSYSFQDTSSEVTFSSSPEIKNRENYKLISVTIPSKNYQVLNFELSPLVGPFQLEAEYLKTFVKTRELKDNSTLIYKNNGTENFDSWHLGVNYMLTNHKRSYKMSNGSFGAVEAEKGGAWQLAARYSEIDLKKGGKEKNYSFAVNWYATKEVRVTANYVKAYAEGSSTQELDTLAFRVQTVF